MVRFQVRYGMNGNRQSPRWVLNGLRFMELAQFRPILDMLFVNTIDIHSTDARHGHFGLLVDMVMDGE
jgi:hypothetical protein